MGIRNLTRRDFLPSLFFLGLALGHGARPYQVSSAAQTEILGEPAQNLDSPQFSEEFIRVYNFHGYFRKIFTKYPVSGAFKIKIGSHSYSIDAEVFGKGLTYSKSADGLVYRVHSEGFVRDGRLVPENASLYRDYSLGYTINDSVNLSFFYGKIGEPNLERRVRDYLQNASPDPEARVVDDDSNRDVLTAVGQILFELKRGRTPNTIRFIDGNLNQKRVNLKLEGSSLYIYPDHFIVREVRAIINEDFQPVNVSAKVWFLLLPIGYLNVNFK